MHVLIFSPRNIWTASPSLQLPSPYTQNTVPMTHYKNITTQLVAMLIGEYNSNSDFYVPCVDSNTESVQSILEKVNMKVNPNSDQVSIVNHVMCIIVSDS